MRQIIERAKNGDQAAFKAIFESYSDKVFGFALTRLASRDDALDLTQEIFIDLWQALDKFNYRSEQAFGGFLFKIAKRKLARHIKTKKKTIPLEENFIPSSATKVDEYNLLAQVNKLPPPHRNVLRLRYWVGLTFSEIAASIGTSESAAKVRHHRALKKLKLLVQENEII